MKVKNLLELYKSVYFLSLSFVLSIAFFVLCLFCVFDFLFYGLFYYFLLKLW